MFPLAQTDNSVWAERIDTLARTPLSTIVLIVTVATVLRLAIMPFVSKVPPPHLRDGKYKTGLFFNEFLDAIIYAGVFVFLVIRPFVLQAFRIPSGSMLETLQLQDLIVANKFVYRVSDPKRGDIVVFRPPVYACEPAQIDQNGQVKADFIKRCIGVPGDVITIQSGQLMRNGQIAKEPYVSTNGPYDFKLVNYKGKVWPVILSGGTANEPMFGTRPPFVPETLEDRENLIKLPPAPIPKGFVLCFGDNRMNSSDGRMWGLVPREDVIGRSEAVWWPFKRWGITR